MNAKEFAIYIEEFMSSKNGFLAKIREYEDARNKRRAPAKRWAEEMVERRVEKIWGEFLVTIYEKIRPQITNYTEPQAWIDFVQKDGFLEQLNDSIDEIELN